MSELIVEATDVAMSYRVPKSPASSLKQTFLDALRRRVGYTNVHALKGVSFELTRGETLAIIGRNGAGKSTMLKVVSRVLPPSQGRMVVRGKVAPMIELGAGFNPELTGAENVVLYGTLLGRDPKHMQERVAELADWAGLTAHIERPLRTYSSGMVSRLAFAVATDEAPDLLLVDEVLSVGDVEFQEKSEARMNSMVNSGAAVILVTHSMKTVLDMATKVIWLDQGEVRAVGEAQKVVDMYLADVHGHH